MSQIIKVILLSIFNGEQGTLPDTFGVLLILLASKGDSGSKSCLKCEEAALRERIMKI